MGHMSIRQSYVFLCIIFIRIPSLGRNVASAKRAKCVLSAIGWPDSSFIIHLLAIVAIAMIPSVHAKDSPTQALGPPPTGK